MKYVTVLLLASACWGKSLTVSQALSDPIDGAKINGRVGRVYVDRRMAEVCDGDNVCMEVFVPCGERKKDKSCSVKLPHPNQRVRLIEHCGQQCRVDWK